MTATDHEALFVRPAEAAKLANLSTRAVYREIQRGERRATRLCSRPRIPRDAFDEWVDGSAVRVERPIVEVRTVPAVHGSFRRLLSEREEAAMSVERVERKDGSIVCACACARNRSKVLGRKRDAEAFDAELVRRKRTGEFAQLDANKESLADFGEEWWRLYAEPNLARRSTRSSGMRTSCCASASSAARVDAGPRQPLPTRPRGRRCWARIDPQVADAPAGRAAARVRVGPRACPRPRQRSSSLVATAARGRSPPTRTGAGGTYTPAATAAGVQRPRPYDLRHSFVSLLIAEGHNIVEVARQAGHSPKMATPTRTSSRSSTQPSA
jgi:excisionase family DNA binding protein